MNKGKTYVKNSPVLINASSILYEGGGKTLDKLFDLVYPVGSIYLSVNSTNPKDLFGGTWEMMYGGYLYATNGSHSYSSYTGTGTQSTTLTVNQIPSHTHSFKRNGGYSNGIMVDTGALGAWGSPIYQVSTSNYTAVPNTPSIDSTGGGQGHTHNVAYIAVRVWKRTA